VAAFHGMDAGAEMRQPRTAIFGCQKGFLVSNYVLMRLNRNSALAGVGFCTVSDLSPGCEGVISGFLNRDVALRRFREMGLVEGTGVRVVRKAPFRGAIEIAVRGARLSIRNEAASQIAVRLVGELE